MKPVNESFRIQLEDIAKDLVFGPSGEGRVIPFIWEISKQGELTAEKLMLSNTIWGNKSLMLISFEDFMNETLQRADRHEENAKRFLIDVIKQSLIEDSLRAKRLARAAEILQEHLRDLEIYTVYFPDDCFYTFIGKTTQGDYFGVASPNVDYDGFAINEYGNTSDRYLLSSTIPSSTILDLLHQLETEVFYPEGCYLRLKAKHKVWNYIYEFSETREEILGKLLMSANFLIVKDFVGVEGINRTKDDFSEEEPERNYQSLESFLKSHFTDLRSYILGCVNQTTPEYNIYSVGMTSYRDWVGVMGQVTVNP